MTTSSSDAVSPLFIQNYCKHKTKSTYDIAKMIIYRVSWLLEKGGFTDLFSSIVSNRIKDTDDVAQLILYI